MRQYTHYGFSASPSFGSPEQRVIVNDAGLLNPTPVAVRLTLRSFAD
jgi:hypothetical protein